MAKAATYTFLNPDPLSKTVVLWLRINLIATIAVIPLSVIAVGVGPPDAPIDTPLWIDIPFAVTAFAQLTIYLTAGFLVLKWIYRVSRNAHSTARGLEVRPPWAVGWYFVPVASLWKPFQAMRETWQASTRPEAWRTVPVPPLLRWWWGLFLASNLLGSISVRLSLRAATLGDMAAAHAIDVAVCVLEIPLNLVLIRIVRELTRRQVIDMTFGDAALRAGAAAA